MELTDHLKSKVLQYKNSLELLWDIDERNEFREWHNHHFGAFGISGHCWFNAIQKAIIMYKI